MKFTGLSACAIFGLDNLSKEVNALAETQRAAGRVAGLAVTLLKTSLIAPSVALMTIEALAFTIINGTGLLFSDEYKEHFEESAKYLALLSFVSVLSPIFTIVHLLQGSFGVLYDPEGERKTVRDSILYSFAEAIPN